MSRLLGRSKSQRLKPTRRDAQQEVDMLQAPPIERSGRSGRSGRNITPAQVATGPGRWADIPDIQPRPKTSNAASPPSWNHAKGPPIVITADDEVFLFPTPTPRKAHFSPPLACSPSTPASGVRSESDTIEIGLAIGSPSQVQHFQSLQPCGLRKPGSHDVFSSAKSAGSSNELREPRHDMNDANRPKISRWRSIGRVFGKRDRNAAQTSECQPLREPDRQPLRESDRQPLREPDRQPLREPDRQPLREPDRQPLREPDFRPDDRTTRSSDNSWPAQFDQAQDAPKKCKQSAMQRKCTEHPATLPTHPSTAPENVAALRQRPILDVDIPDIQLERYSVMFSGLLRSQQSNLLARRQGDKAATLKPLQIPPTPTSPGLRRRATSPNTSTPPSYTLFPPSASRKLPERSDSILARPRPLPLRRSKTAPAAHTAHNAHNAHALLQPLTPMTEVSEADGLGESARESLTPTPEEGDGPETPGDEDGLWKIGVAMGAEEDEEFGRWEMITVGKRIEPGDRISLGQVEVEVGEVEVEDRVRRPYRAEVGIARSLSLTKARRGLIRGPRVEEGERVSELKTLTPTVVQMRGRKSVMVQIEDA